MKEEKRILIKQIESIHEMTKETCEMCESSYEEELDGATTYFLIGETRFKMNIQKI